MKTRVPGVENLAVARVAAFAHALGHLVEVSAGGAECRELGQFRLEDQTRLDDLPRARHVGDRALVGENRRLRTDEGALADMAPNPIFRLETAQSRAQLGARDAKPLRKLA